MKNKFNLMFIVSILSISLFYFLSYQSLNSDNIDYADQKILLNEIEQRSEESLDINEQIDQLENTLIKQSANQEAIKYLGISYIALLLLIGILYFYLYSRLIRPFKKMEVFAQEIANGNLDFPLLESRGQLFGSFNWAFDHMRYELKRARENEQIAILNSKTMIATISHDIKTPIASISAYSEALQANLDNTTEKRERYIQVILHKCSEVTQLTNDLFLHSLSDLEELAFTMTNEDSKQLINELKNDWILQYGDRIELSNNLPMIQVSVDKRRFTQAMENIISNAMKYTEGNVTVSFHESEDYFSVSIKDNGSGIQDVDMPFIMDKFYRGKNTENKPGAGLGLFIVQDIMNKMNGKIELNNSPSGLEVILSLQREN
ncbi:HAMP domain-containing sensor histidine kinase [Breznakia pachnodae]|uniref:histidine kinase n=1 Tax=Breznakia pachnodae TaxID=265178 RepID=A0ABU0E239_9FIRM|nr:HAMP domain-containing sensor histidine kinase [Breznakia pachnodae]MDQ0360946.1 signal transduction histidine kinase [Breznakia pachnodae]